MIILGEYCCLNLLLLSIFSYITTEAKDRDVNCLLAASNVLLRDRRRAVWICLHRWSEQYRHCSGTQPSHIHYDKWIVVCKLAYMRRIMYQMYPVCAIFNESHHKEALIYQSKGVLCVNLFWSGKSLNLDSVLSPFDTKFTLHSTLFFSVTWTVNGKLWKCFMQCSCSMQSVLVCAATLQSELYYFIAAMFSISMLIWVILVCFLKIYTIQKQGQ